MAKKAPKKRQTRERKPRTLSPQVESQSSGAQIGEVIPALTPERAAIFGKILSIGCPPEKALGYFAPDLSPETRKTVARAWVNDLQVQEALKTIWGGTWMDLPAERRYELALEKMVAEAAFYLWSTNWSDLTAKEDLDKAKQAREMLMNHLGKKPDASDPMQLFAMFGLELARNIEAVKKVTKKLPAPPPEPDLVDAVAETIPRRVN